MFKALATVQFDERRASLLREIDPRLDRRHRGISETVRGRARTIQAESLGFLDPVSGCLYAACAIHHESGRKRIALSVLRIYAGSNRSVVRGRWRRR